MKSNLIRYGDQPGPRQPKAGRARVAFKVLVALLILLCANWLLTFAIMPVSEHDIWKRYRAHSDDPIDAMVVGSSFSIQSFDPTGLDQALGSHTFSLSWLGASLRSDRLALETAIRDHGITRAYIGIGPETLTDESTADLVKSNVQYTYWKMDGESFSEQARDLLYLVSDPTAGGNAKSFAAIFPWSIDYVDRTPSAIIDNVRKKVGYLTGNLEEEPFDYASSTGIGHIYKGTYDVDTMTAPYASSPSSDTTTQPVQDNMDALASICDLCRDNGVELYVIVTPRPTYEVYHLGLGYAQLMGSCKQLVESHGATYIDSNALHADVYHPLATDFADAQHLNEDGSARFTSLVGNLVTSVESGEDISGDFYSYDDWSSYLATVQGIVLTGLDGTVEAGRINLSAYSYAESDTQVEYEFVVAFEGDDAGAYVARPYGTEADYELPTEGHGYVTVRVNSREAGSSAEFEHYCAKTFQY